MASNIPPEMRKLPRWLPLMLLVLGLVLLLGDRLRTYDLIVDGTPLKVRAIAFTPAQVLSAAGYTLGENDAVWPAADKTDLAFTTVVLRRARPVTVTLGDETVEVSSSAIQAGSLLAEAGIPFFETDILLLDGQEITPNAKLPLGRNTALELIPARTVRLQIGTEQRNLFTHAETLGEALLEAGYQLRPKDRLSPAASTVLPAELDATLDLAELVSVTIAGGTQTGLSAAETVGQALSELGFSLQGLDRAQPEPEEPLPANKQIKLVRVRESISLAIEETPNQNTYTEDPNAELDTISVVEAGTPGMVVTRTRTQTADGQPLATQAEGPWKATDPIDGVLGWGTKVVVKTEVVNGETLEYWRKLSVYATGYTPSSQGGHTGTASGIPLTRGIIAVIPSWYRAGMKFQRVYVPGYGYGTIADTGGGIPGTPWIDLGFDNDNYVSWHSWTTMYLLTPVPACVPTLLP